MALANYFVEFSSIDKLWFILSPQNPFKKRETLLNDYSRLELIRVAIEKYPQKYYVSNIEFNMPKPSYTVDTLAYLTEKHPEHEFVLIMGSDNLKTLHKWKNYSEIISNHKIYVYPRPNTNLEKLDIQADYKVFDAPKIELSSSFIRKSIKEGKNVSFFLPAPVADLIEQQNFYKK